MTGQVYVGRDIKSIKIKGNRLLNRESSGKSYEMTSDLSIAPKFCMGFDTLFGVNILGCLVFASVGVDAAFMKVSGSVVGSSVAAAPAATTVEAQPAADGAAGVASAGSNPEKGARFGISFGSDGLVVNGLTLPEVKQRSKIFCSFSVGAGVRKYFGKFFAGVEVKRLYNASRDLKLQYAKYDPDGIAGELVSSSLSQDKLLIPVKKGEKTLAVVIGARL
jgi:hypothetical protein